MNLRKSVAKNTNFVLMKFKLFSLLILFSISLSAKKFPKWKDGNFKTTSSGLQYKIVKKGKGDSIGRNDSVVLEYVCYQGNDRKVIFTTEKLPGKKFSIDLSKNSLEQGFMESVLLLKEHGSGYFAYSIPNEEGVLYFIRVVKVIHNYSQFLPIENPPIDTTATFHFPDPNKNRYGDSILTTMQLVETPFPIYCHGNNVTMQAVKFSISYFDGESKHKTVLIFIDCPDQYGKDFFVPGKDYMITAIPLMENQKQVKNVQNSYSNEKDESYYCLRIRRMN